MILQNNSKATPNKSHGPGKISIRMISICGTKGEFPYEWRKANVVTAQTKNDKQ